MGPSEAEKDPGELIRNESLVWGLISQPRLGGGGGKTLAEPKPSKSYFLEKLKKKNRTWQRRYLGELIRKESLVEGGGQLISSGANQGWKKTPLSSICLRYTLHTVSQEPFWPKCKASRKDLN